MENIIKAYEDTEKELLKVFTAFSEEKVNERPSFDGWTAAQVADHIIKAQSNFPQLMKGKSQSVSRDPEEKKDQTAKLFLDFSTKMQSPDFILPAPGKHSKNEMITMLNEKHEEITGAMRTADLKAEYTDFELPGFGTFTGYEWGWFIIFHTQRHIHQMKNIAKDLGVAY